MGVHLPGDWRSTLLTDQDVRFARQLVHFRKPRKDQILIGVDPGKGKCGTRVTAGTLSYLLGVIQQQYRSKLVVLATPDEDLVATQFEQASRGERIELPRHNVKDTVGLLTQCDLFLAGNTNLFHFAAAFGVPTIGLFTDRDERRWIPPDKPHLAIVHGRRGEKQSTEQFLALVERLLSLPPREI
jgi:ADP-heptose:LPS heptosyltransferase